ncbi:MAG TPA: ferredoxin:thioredoxin reductase [Candidatus Parcubacteria bacterium]|nr:ferredoxin:thioredoxin reductase [Candidatus Parcubacteria bacterium]
MTKEELLEKYKKYAEEKGLNLNPDPQALDRTLNGLIANEQKYGKLYCPCRRVTGDKEEDEKIVCPCAFHLKEIEKYGHCLCGLFFKKE